MRFLVVSVLFLASVVAMYPQAPFLLRETPWGNCSVTCTSAYSRQICFQIWARTTTIAPTLDNMPKGDLVRVKHVGCGAMTITDRPRAWAEEHLQNCLVPSTDSTGKLLY